VVTHLSLARTVTHEGRFKEKQSHPWLLAMEGFKRGQEGSTQETMEPQSALAAHHAHGSGQSMLAVTPWGVGHTAKPCFLGACGECRASRPQKGFALGRVHMAMKSTRQQQETGGGVI